jgi:hypothetical protein
VPVRLPEIPEYEYTFLSVEDIEFPPKAWIDYAAGPAVSTRSFFIVFEHKLAHRIPLEDYLSGKNKRIMDWAVDAGLADWEPTPCLSQNGYLLAWSFRELHQRGVELRAPSLYTGQAVKRSRKARGKSTDINAWEASLSQEHKELIAMLYDQYIFARGCFGAKPEGHAEDTDHLVPYRDLTEDELITLCQWASAGLCTVLELLDPVKRRQGYTHQWVPRSFITKVACSTRYLSSQKG